MTNQEAIFEGLGPGSCGEEWIQWARVGSFQSVQEFKFHAVLEKSQRRCLVCGTPYVILSVNIL